MNRFDLCIIENSDIKKYINAYAFILDMDEEPFYDVEIWNFDFFDGAEIDRINKQNLRKATKKEEEEYLKKFNEYCKDYL